MPATEANLTHAQGRFIPPRASHGVGALCLRTRGKRLCTSRSWSRWTVSSTCPSHTAMRCGREVSIGRAPNCGESTQLQRPGTTGTRAASGKNPERTHHCNHRAFRGVDPPREIDRGHGPLVRGKDRGTAITERCGPWTLPVILIAGMARSYREKETGTATTERFGLWVLPVSGLRP